MTVPWSDLGLVLLVGLAVGAVLVSVFALGVTFASGGEGPGGRPVARIPAYLCFVACGLVAAYGIYLAIPSLHKLF
jgi:hypothetical protein